MSALRRVMPEMYWVNTPQSRMERHLEVLARIGRGECQTDGPGCVFDFTAQPGTPLTELTFCSYDDAEPGLLAKLCGTMAGLNLRIHTAFIYTLHDEDGFFGAQAQRPIALDTFLLSQSYFGHDRVLTAKTKKSLSDELARVLRGENTVAYLLARRHRRPLTPLNIYDIALDNRGLNGLTRLSLHAEDSRGVLYRTTAALAQMGFHIRAAHISTRDDDADDIFLITNREGQALPLAMHATVIAELRSLLQESVIFAL